MIGMGNLGYLMIFGGCLGAGHATAGSASSASDDWLWEGNGVLPSSHAWQYANVSAGGADSSAGVTAGLDGAETKSAVVPVWVILLVPTPYRISVQLSLFLFLFLFLCRCRCRCRCLCSSLFLCARVRKPVWLHGWLPGCLSVCLSACLPVCLPVCLSVCLSVRH